MASTPDETTGPQQGSALHRPGHRLTEPERLLCAHLARVRYLTKEQAWRLVYPGRWESKVSERLTALGRLGFLRHARPDGTSLAYVAKDGRWVAPMALTTAGYALALKALGDLPKLPAKDLGKDFIEHNLGLVELYLRMVGAGPERLGPRNRRGVKRSAGPASGTAQLAPLPRDWTWTPGETVSLPIRKARVVEDESGLIHPDAVIEFKQPKLRVFVEWETGANAIKSDKRGALFTKFTRYDELFMGFADTAGRTTWYAQAYPDAWRPAVLFALHSQKRKANVAAALEGWRAQRPGRRDASRFFVLRTFEEAGAMLAQLANTPTQGANPTASVPTREEDERLRPGRVAVRGERLVAAARCYAELLRILDEAHRAGRPPAPIPAEARHELETLRLYAERGRKALAEHGLKEAV